MTFFVITQQWIDIDESLSSSKATEILMRQMCVQNFDVNPMSF
jgi:hypothetical protein